MSLLLDSEKENRFSDADSLAPCDSNTTLVELVEKIEIDWPEFLPVEHIGPGLVRMAFGLLLVVVLTALSVFLWR